MFSFLFGNLFQKSKFNYSSLFMKKYNAEEKKVEQNEDWEKKQKKQFLKSLHWHQTQNGKALEKRRT